MSDILTLNIAKIEQETEDTVSIYLDIPSDKVATMQHKAGQYLTVILDSGEEELRRSYSMSSAPEDNFYRFSVKKVPGGKVSPVLTEQTVAGQPLQVLPPDGLFQVVADPEARRTHYFIGAGSGITPIMSMARHLLAHEPKSRIVLLYGSRNEKNIIFQDELDQLARDYEGQFYVQHTISKPSKIKKKGLSGMLGGKESLWKGLTGRIDRDKIYGCLDEHYSYSEDRQYYVCGPGKMIDNTVLHLKGRGVDSDDIHREYFSAEGVTKSLSTGNIVDNADLYVRLDKKDIDIKMIPGRTVLESLMDAGYEPPYSCTSGACSTCIAKLTEGEVHMDVCLALDETELSEGYILTCQARALTDSLRMDFDA